MLDNIIKLYEKYKKIINYIIFGTSTAIVNIGVKYLLLFTLLDASNGFQLQVAIVVSWIAAVLFAYLQIENMYLKVKMIIN